MVNVMNLNRIQSVFTKLRGKFLKYDISVKDNWQSVDLILQHPNLSVIRFGDGEFDIINGKSIPYQIYDSNLSNMMKKIMLNGSNSRLLVCLPDVFSNINRYNKSCKDFFYQKFFYQNRQILTKIAKTNNCYGSTFISRPYIDLKDKTNSKKYFQKLRSIWKNKDILIVEGKYSRSGEGNDLFANAKSISRIVCPPKNAYSYLERIEKSIRKNAANRLILLMLGPTAKVIVNDLYCELNNQMIDLGHIDSEYEWFLMGAKSKVKIPHKHTAEFNYDDDKVNLMTDNKFNEQVVDRIINE